MKTEATAAGSKRVLATLACSILLASLGISIATVALPTLAQAFSAGVAQVQWVVLAYLFAMTAAIVLAGRLGDLYGNRRVLITGLIVFTVASTACALAPSLAWLILGRVAQGLSAAILMSLPMAMTKTLVAKARLGTAMGLLGTMSAIGTAAGPSLGGILIGDLGWRAALAVLALCSAGLLALAMTNLPKTPASATAPRLDWAGSLWLSTVLLCFALLATGSRAGIALPPWLLLALGAVALLAFIRTERRAAHPLVPVALVRSRAVATSLVMNLLIGAIMMSTLVVGSFFLSFGLGLSAAQTGMVMAVGPIAAALSGVPAGRLTDRFGAGRTLLAGLLLATTGLIGFALLPAHWGVAGYVMALLIMTPGFQLFLAANNTVMMANATDEHRGLLAGLLGLSRNLGFMTGASLLPLLFASMLAGQDVADSARPVIGQAFSVTFLAAAGLGLLALVLARFGTTALSRPPSTPGHPL